MPTRFSRTTVFGKFLAASFLAVLSAPVACAQRADALSPQVRNYVSVSTSKVVLEHVEMAKSPPLHLALICRRLRVRRFSTCAAIP